MTSMRITIPIPPDSDEELSKCMEPCPFCGGEVELRPEIDNRDETYAIHCKACHMHFTKFVWRSYDGIDVVKEWNRRMKS